MVEFICYEKIRMDLDMEEFFLVYFKKIDIFLFNEWGKVVIF